MKSDNKYSTTTKELKVMPMGSTELAKLYGVSRHTFRKWISKIENVIGKRDGYHYTIRQVEMIFEILGIPHTIMV